MPLYLHTHTVFARSTQQHPAAPAAPSSTIATTTLRHLAGREAAGSLEASAATLEIVSSCRLRTLRLAVALLEGLPRRAPEASTLGSTHLRHRGVPARAASRAWPCRAPGRGVFGPLSLCSQARGHPWAPDHIRDIASHPGRVPNALRRTADPQ